MTDDDMTELNFELQSRRMRDEFLKWLEMMNDHGIMREEVAVPAVVQILNEIFVSCRPQAGILAPMEQG